MYYSYVHKISFGDPSTNGTQPLWGLPPQG